VIGSSRKWGHLASGNVAFESPSTSRAKVSQLLEVGLGEALGYDVPNFLRSAREIAAIAAATPFVEPLGAAGGKLQVSLLAKAPSAAQRRKTLSFATQQDQLAIEGRELYWLPEGKITESELDMKGVEKALGAMTTRTQRTLRRLSKRLLDA
jgi:uncharacterized protein (DUF1697 family)